MKIRELVLAAYGPFTDRKLRFDEEASGLHIVYGPNEAGKSSALRGLEALLYGIDARTLDNFLHDNNKLRINGCLRNVDGQELTFVRRKGNKNTLLTPAGEELDDQALAPFLQGVTQELFGTLFGIDHRALVQGGQEILDQKGDVGEALFASALGSHTLHAVLKDLDGEADELFKPRGSTQAINASIKEFTELNKQIRERSLSSREWDQYRQALARTNNSLAEVQGELTSNRAEVNRLIRIQRLLPKLARRRELMSGLEELDDDVILPDDFVDRHHLAAKELETALAMVAKTKPRLEGLQKQLEGLSINRDLIDQAEKIEDLHARLGGHRKALQDRPHLEAERQQLLKEAEFLLKEVRPELDLANVEQLRSLLARRQSIGELGAKQAVLIAKVEQAESSRREIDARLTAAQTGREKRLEPGSTDALRRTIAAARKLGDTDAAIQTTQSELTSTQAGCAAGLSALTLWEGALEDLPGLAVPSRESINQFENLYDELNKRSQRLKEREAEAQEQLQTTLLQLDEVRRAGEVPTEAELVEVRARRDQIWQLLRRQWIIGADVTADASQFDEEGSLPDAFEHRQSDADELSDRLRRETDRVHLLASLQATQESVSRQTEEHSQKLGEYGTEKGLLDTDWQALWADCHIRPRTPREMRTWLDAMENLREQVKQLTSHRQKNGELIQRRIDHIQLLSQQMTDLGIEVSKSETLETVLLECEATAQELDEIKQNQMLLDKEIEDLETDLASSTEEHRLAVEQFDGWQTEWRDSMARYGLEADTSPSESVVFVEKVRELFDKQNDAAKLQIRIKAIDEDADIFRDQVSGMVKSIASELAEIPADDAVTRLNTLLSDNRAEYKQRQQIEEQVVLATQEIQDSNATIQVMTERLDSLCVEAKRKTHAELEEAERESARYLQTKTSIDLIEQETLEAGEGATLAELELEATNVDPDALPGRIEELNNNINDDLEPKRTELAEAKGREEKELELMDGGDDAASLADQAQNILASIRSDAERYTRVKLASRILRDEIERYRKENQGPLIQRASEHFASLTLGSFEAVMTDFDQKDEPILVGVRQGGERVHVAGMSNGTRDQLYLALRFASLEKFMESSEPMPFIVDDVLVDFDDGRSAAALNSLADLASKTQVILFTHHARVVEQARALDADKRVQIHEL